MDVEHRPLEAIQDIKKMMERSSRFISLSGWSGIAAGLCALAGAWVAHTKIVEYQNEINPGFQAGGDHISRPGASVLFNQLILIAVFTFAAAFISAFLFTYFRSNKKGVPIWGFVAKRLLWNTFIPLLAGGVVLLRILQLGDFELVAPCSLIFYGLALVHASKYTLGEVRYLGYAELVLGAINLWVRGNAVYFWAVGFGILHIVYGGIMWWKYERSSN